MNSRALHLHIDRIVVEGLPGWGKQRFVRALEQRLTELAETQASKGTFSAEPRRITRLNAGQLRPGATAEQAAAHVASAVERALSGTEGSAAPGEKKHG